VFLDAPLFSKVIASTPLVSIDLVVRDHNGLVLLGERCNRPAQGYWFVPGGRVLKNETLAAAFQRLCLAELGLALDIEQAGYLGLFEHFYTDSVLSADISTHYIVNAFEVRLSEPQHAALFDSIPKQQHHAYRWFSEPELLASKKVHLHSQWYFQKNKGIR